MILEFTRTKTRDGNDKFYFTILSDSSRNEYRCSVILSDPKILTCNCKYANIKIGIEKEIKVPCKHLKEALDLINYIQNESKTKKV